MEKPSFLSTLLQLLLKSGALFLIGMLYWSQVLIEEDVKEIKKDLNFLKSLCENHKSLPSFLAAPSEKKQSKSPSWERKTAANLLTADPFYQETLPKLLGKGFVPHGTRREATSIRPVNLHPFSNWSQTARWIDMCSAKVAKQKVGQYETYSPDLAEAMELRQGADGKSEFWVFLRRDAFWQPLNPLHFSQELTLAPHFTKKHPVTAYDFKFYFDAIMNPYVEEPGAVAMRHYFSDITSFRIIDDFTFAVSWKTREEKKSHGLPSPSMKYLAKSLTASLKPLPCFVYQYFADGSKIIEEPPGSDAYRSHAIWAQNFAHHFAHRVIVSCGPWVFDGLFENEIRFKRNPDFYEPLAALAAAYSVRFRNSIDAIWQEFKLGSLDLFEVPPNLLDELDLFLKSTPYLEQQERGEAIHRLTYLGRSYNYVGWNEASPLFSSKRVRQALTFAIDRKKIIDQLLHAMAEETTGTFLPSSPSYDASLAPYPFDPDYARGLLLEEGWIDSDGDGIIDKDIQGRSVPFRFTLTYYLKNPTIKAIGEAIRLNLKEIGIDCILNGVDLADLSAIFASKNFDAILLGWALGDPPEDPEQLWSSSGAKETGSSNVIGFANKEVDDIIDLLQYEEIRDKRIDLYHRFDRLLYEEAPYTFLFIPKVTLIYRSYLQNVFVPKERRDLIPGATVDEPDPSLFWIHM